MLRLLGIISLIALFDPAFALSQPPPIEAAPEGDTNTDPPEANPENEPAADADDATDPFANEPDTAADPVSNLIPLLDPELQPEPEPEPEPELDIPPGYGPPLHWDERWGSWALPDQIGLGLLLASTVTFQVLGPRNGDDPWIRTSQLDETVRGGFRLNKEIARQRIRDVSDVFLSITVGWPLLFDGLASALWYHRSPEVARELSLMSVEVQFITASIQSLANVVSSRQRPYVQDCGTEVSLDDRECRARVRYRSFFSGHTSQAFAGAATTCMVHARLPLYGGGTTEAMPCIAMLTLATATGLFRIMGDMHWITDVLTGAAVGITVGTLVPALRMRSQRGDVRISVVPNGLGLGVVGVM